MPALGRVNLIVGKNNIGKSSVLEALRIYTQNASPAFLDELLIGHDEVLHSLNQPPSLNYDSGQIPYQNFFSGRAFPTKDNENIYIGDQEGSNFVKISHTYYIEEHNETTENGLVATKRTPVSKNDNHDEADQALLISSSRRENARWMPISERSLQGFRRGRPWLPDTQTIPVGFVPTGMLPSANLADLWDSIALTDLAEFVTEGLRIIDPEISGIAFVKKDVLGLRRESQRAAIVRLRNTPHPIPLNSMGDGIVRILQLLLALVPARGGIYLVDEFENGLHYSIQDKVWKLIFELAISHDIQVFAATHSWDCITAFKNVASQMQEHAVLFRVGRSIRKSEEGKIIATSFDRDALVQMTQSDLELR